MPPISAAIRAGGTSAPAVIFVLLIGFLTSGCAVLTRSQLQEVKEFGEASDGVASLASEPLESLGQARRFARLVEASGKPEPAGQTTNIWNEMVKADAFAVRFAELGQQLEVSLSVLETYSELLVALATEDFTSGLDAAAKRLGQSFDKAVGAYNKVVRTPQGKPGLSLIGGWVAGAVRAGGGIFIRHLQAERVKEVVTKADPIIADVTAEYAAILEQKVKPAIANAQELTRDNIARFLQRREFLGINESVAIADQIAKNRMAEDLCDLAAAVGLRYRAAHEALLSALRHRRDLKGEIEIIQELADEVRAGQKLQRELQKK